MIIFQLDALLGEGSKLKVSITEKEDWQCLGRLGALLSHFHQVDGLFSLALPQAWHSW